MNYLIITSHPYSGSFNAAAAEELCAEAHRRGHTVGRIDLVADGFSPVMTGEDLRMWSRGGYADPLVKKYMDEINRADVLVFPFPVWWGYMPAILKGFIDKVFIPGWAYRYGENGEMVGMLTGKKAVVTITMETPAEVFDSVFADPVSGAFIKDTLQTCGIEVIRYFRGDRIVSGGRPHAEELMGKIRELII